MPSFLDDETSADAGQPREGFEISTPSITYRLTSGSRDVTINGNVYTASPIMRSELDVPQIGETKSLEITLPASHPLAARYVANGVPPRQITVTAWRKQLRSGQAIKIWQGFVTSMSFEKHTAKFLVPSATGQALTVRLPVITAGRLCPHILYDANCRIARAGFQIVTTVVVHDGRTVTVASMGGKPDQWAQFGELLHVASGERMTVGDQTGAVITIQLPIYELQAGDQVYVYAGCDHRIVTCNSKFANKDNFGGQPQLPNGGNVWLPSGYGIVHS